MTAPYFRPPGVALSDGADLPGGSEDARLYLAHLQSGSFVVLDGSAALVWDAATAEGPALKPQSEALPQEVVVARVADAVGLDADDVRDGVLSLLADLVGRGLLALSGPVGSDL